MAATVRRPGAKIAPHSRTTAWAKVGRVKTTEKVCNKATTSGPGMGGIALRDAGQASPPATKAPPCPHWPSKMAKVELREFVAYYNRDRPHRTLGLQTLELTPR